MGSVIVVVDKFLFGRTKRDIENIAVILASMPHIVDSTAAIRYALEQAANNSGSPRHVNTLRETHRATIEKAEATQ